MELREKKLDELKALAESLRRDDDDWTMVAKYKKGDLVNWIEQRQKDVSGGPPTPAETSADDTRSGAEILEDAQADALVKELQDGEDELTARITDVFAEGDEETARAYLEPLSDEQLFDQLARRTGQSFVEDVPDRSFVIDLLIADAFPKAETLAAGLEVGSSAASEVEPPAPPTPPVPDAVEPPESPQLGVTLPMAVWAVIFEMAAMAINGRRHFGPPRTVRVKGFEWEVGVDYTTKTARVRSLGNYGEQRDIQMRINRLWEKHGIRGSASILLSKATRAERRKAVEELRQANASIDAGIEKEIAELQEQYRVNGPGEIQEVPLLGWSDVTISPPV